MTDLPFTLPPWLTYNPYDPSGNTAFFLVLGATALCVFIAILYLIRSLLHIGSRAEKSLNRIVLRISVPKEKKPEYQNSSQEERLEHIKEEIGTAETFFSTIAGLRAQRGIFKWLRGRTDHFAFEIVIHNGLIYFYIDVSQKLRKMVEQQVNAQYPNAQIEEMTDYNIFTEKSKIAAAYISDSSAHIMPFRTYKAMDSDPLSALLTTLTQIKENNSSAAIQYVIRSAHKRWRRKGVRIVREVKKGKKFEKVIHQKLIGRIFEKLKEAVSLETKKDEKSKEIYTLSAMEEEMIKGVEQKLSKGGMDVTVRLISVSDDKEMARMQLDNLINAYSQYNLYRYGNSINAFVPRNQGAIIRDFIYRSFNERRKMLLNTEEMAGFWHLPLHSTETPNISWLGARKAPPPSNLPHEGLLMGHVQYRGLDTQIKIKEADRRRHTYIIGKSGTGKSVLMSNLIKQDIEAGKGVGLIDPHGDLAEQVLAFIPKHRADDVVVFNPSDLERPIGLNMLEAKTDDQKDFAIQEMMSIFYKLFPPEMIGPMFEHSMRNVMLTLMADLDDPGTIIDIPRMFTDDSYVKIYLKKLKDPVVRAFWEKEMAKTSDFHKSEMLGYLISKVGRFVENEMMRNIMGQQKSGFNFREIMDQEKIFIVNLSKGTTGEVNAKLLGLIVVAKLQMAAMGRASMADEDRKDFYLYIDEFQNAVTDSIAIILSEARKYKLNLILAHQYMGQLIDEKGRAPVKDAVLGNVGTMCSGRIGPEDAEVLVKEFSPTFGVHDLLNPAPYSYFTKLLVDNEPTRPFSMLGYPPQKGNRELGEAIKQLSRLKYGRDRRIVEAEILERTKLGPSSKDADTGMIEASL